MSGGPVDRATLRGLLDGGGGGARGAVDAGAPGGADLRWSGLPAPAPAVALDLRHGGLRGELGCGDLAPGGPG